MRNALIAASLVLGSVSTVHAQEPDGPPPAADPSRTQFDAAFDAMTRGDFQTAAVGFRAVAASSPDPELRGAAIQLGRLAEDFQRRGTRLTFSNAPGLAGPMRSPKEVGVSEDDEIDGGRTSFIITSTVASFYTGIVLVDLSDSEDIKGGTLIVMGTTAAGLVGSLYATRGRTMTGGMADAYGLGMALGVGNSLLLSSPLGVVDADTNASEKTQLFVLGSAWGGAAAGLMIADRIRPTRAQVSVTSTIGAMGMISTLLGLAILQPDDLDGDTFLTVTALGLDAGVVAGAGFAGKLDWSLSRARLVGLSAFLGALAGVGTSILLFADDDGSDDNTARMAAGITLGGLWGGFALGTRLTRDMAPDYRFRAKPGVSANLSPTMIRSAPGLSVVGSF
jgi:hypothetical protein